MSKLTEAQRRVLAAMDAGNQLIKHFDVWMGYWWDLYGGLIVTNRTADALIKKGLISLGEEKSVFSGRRSAIASLTDAGRKALEGKADGE